MIGLGSDKNSSFPASSESLKLCQQHPTSRWLTSGWLFPWCSSSSRFPSTRARQSWPSLRRQPKVKVFGFQTKILPPQLSRCSPAAWKGFLDPKKSKSQPSLTLFSRPLWPPFKTSLTSLIHRWPLMICALMSDIVLPLASTLFVIIYWAIGLLHYYTWPKMQELCIA